MRKAIRNLYKRGMKKLVLDLRNNPGGYLGKAADMVDLFISEGRIVSSKGRINIDDQVFYAHSFNTVSKRTPLIVLINEGSASASEIVAGAIKDTNRGVVIGTKSYGKGSVQRVIQLSNGDEEFGLKLTTAYYYTAAGRLIHNKGIKPDIKIKTPDYNIEQILAQRLISKRNLVKKFVKRYKKPTKAQIAAFHRRLKRRNLPIPFRLLGKMVYNEVHKTDMPPVYDLEWDIQLRKAVKIFRTRRSLFRRKVLAYDKK
jgi:carboxyl-terminal processing protease